MKLYSDELIEISKKTANIEIKEIALKLKLEVSNSPFIKEYLNFTDSINLAKDIRRNQFNYHVYQYEAKEKDLNKSKLQNERLLYLIIAIGLIFVALYFILKYKHRKEKIQQIYNTETRISRKIHDEVANDVYHVMTRLQDQPEENKTLLDDLENIYNRTRDISKENSTIDLRTNYQDLLIDLFLSYNSTDVNVMTKNLHQIDWNQLNDLKKSTMYRVFQELLTNMKKHSKASVVVFNFGTEHKKITVNYKDNGIGCDIKKGNGLQNTVNRIDSINGTVTFESEVQKGFKVIITI
jgi:signal transduction histidine kinase